MSAYTEYCMEPARSGDTLQQPPGLEPSSLSDLKVEDTDPDETARIWQLVASSNEMSSKGSKASHSSTRTPRQTSNAGRQSGTVSARSVFDSQGSVTTLESSVTNNARTISPRSPKFTSMVLKPRGIVINDTNSIVPSAFSHFGTAQPENDEPIDYRSITGLSGTYVWITVDDDAVKDITAEYKEMRGQNLCEEEFATLAKEQFLRGERRSRSVSQDRQFRAERMLQLVSPPKETAHWRVPPLLDEAGAEEADWAWDIRPDCAYWLSLRGFNPKYRFQIQNATYVRDSITCPYFTVEFNEDP